tara:strand:- start:63457 stop:64302 length:846 start_codon:yes stop_codon:yes gene_type:complete
MTDKDKNIKKEESEELKNSEQTVPEVEEAPEAEAASKVEETPEAEAAPEVEAAPETEEVLEKMPNNDNGVDLPFIIGTKVGMTQIFSSNGTVYPVSVIQAGPCVVTQIKTDKTDGYNSIQLGFSDKKDSKESKSLLGHYRKSGSVAKKYLKEFRYQKSSDIELGKEVLVNQFNVGDLLTVTGTSKGKGFAGHMKRHNFSGGRASHGKNSVMRKAGSIGAGTSPGRVWKGTRMAGRMGGDKITVKNLELIKVDLDKQLLFVSGSIPGSNKNVVYISRTNYES